MSRVGTWTWAQQTGGRLRRRDRAELMRQAVVAQMARVVTRGGQVQGLDIEIPTPPDSALARLAEERARELSSPPLYAHCLRTWVFSEMFAARERVGHDGELLYVACMLHDLGLTSAHDRLDGTAHCFAVEGARAAHGLMVGHGEPEHRARAVGEAITLHLNVTVPSSMGVEAYLMSKGVSLDTIGRRLHQLPTCSVGAVSDRWQRDGFTEELVSLTGRQAELRPQSRSAFLHRLGFAGMLRANPLDR
jgi:hypothetical protein